MSLTWREAGINDAHPAICLNAHDGVHRMDLAQWQDQRGEASTAWRYTCKNCNNHYDLVERKWDNKKPAGGVCSGNTEHRPYWDQQYIDDGHLDVYRPWSDKFTTQVVKCEWCKDDDQHVYDTELKVWAPLSAYLLVRQTPPDQLPSAAQMEALYEEAVKVGEQDSARYGHMINDPWWTFDEMDMDVEPDDAEELSEFDKTVINGTMQEAMEKSRVRARATYDRVTATYECLSEKLPKVLVDHIVSLGSW